MRRHGNFKDMTLISGADFREDGRGFVLFDFDLDGFQDLGVTSPNYPRFRVVRNQMANLLPVTNGYVTVELIGGHTGTDSTIEWSPREPYGARVLVTVGEKQRMFQLTCGEGVSVQNAKRIHIGMGQSAMIDELTVIWPSGKTTVKNEIASGQRIRIYENPANQ